MSELYASTPLSHRVKNWGLTVTEHCFNHGIVVVYNLQLSHDPLEEGTRQAESGIAKSGFLGNVNIS